MDDGKKKLSGSGEASKKGLPLGLIALVAAGGVVVGSVGTYILTKPQAAPEQSASPAAGGTPSAPTITMPSPQPPAQGQYTPAPQPPGEAPPGKVWSVEHGHWHDAPVAQTLPAPILPAVIPTTPTPAPTPAPPAAPAEKKE